MRLRWSCISVTAHSACSARWRSPASALRVCPRAPLLSPAHAAKTGRHADRQTDTKGERKTERQRKTRERKWSA
eukprot:1843716-Rhodomonas_salina.2